MLMVGTMAIACMLIMTTGCLSRTVYVNVEAPDLRGVITIHTAQSQYHARFARYASNLADLGPATASLIPEDLATGTKGGYRFAMQPTPSGYEIRVWPTRPDISRQRTLFSDQTQVIRFSEGREPANARSKAIE